MNVDINLLYQSNLCNSFGYLLQYPQLRLHWIKRSSYRWPIQYPRLAYWSHFASSNLFLHSFTKYFNNLEQVFLRSSYSLNDLILVNWNIKKNPTSFSCKLVAYVTRVKRISQMDEGPNAKGHLNNRHRFRRTLQ